MEKESEKYKELLRGYRDTIDRERTAFIIRLQEALDSDGIRDGDEREKLLSAAINVFEIKRKEEFYNALDELDETMRKRGEL